MKQESKVIQIATTLTTAQAETALNVHLNAGWTFVGVFEVGTSKFFAVFTRIISQ
jgi:hypothetical protein